MVLLYSYAGMYIRELYCTTLNVNVNIIVRAGLDQGSSYGLVSTQGISVLVSGLLELKAYGSIYDSQMGPHDPGVSGDLDHEPKPKQPAGRLLQDRNLEYDFSAYLQAFYPWKATSCQRVMGSIFERNLAVCFSI